MEQTLTNLTLAKWCLKHSFVYFFFFSIRLFGQFKADSTYKPLNVAILLYDGVELLDFSGLGEVFQQTYFNGKRAFNVFTVGVNSNKIVSQGFLNRWNDSMGTEMEDGAVESGEKFLKQKGWTVGKHRY